MPRTELGDGPLTEPLDDHGTNPILRIPAATLNEPAAFAGTRYRFTTGVRAGRSVPIRGDGEAVLLTYTSFASAIGIVAALMAGIVTVAGGTAALFLSAEGRPLPAIAAAMLALFFALFIAMLVPATNVQVVEGDVPAIVIAQKSRFALPRVAYAVMTAEGETLAFIRRTIFSRLGRNRWKITGPDDERHVAEAVEESLDRAFLRKVAGKFNRKFESNLHIRSGYETLGSIMRRPDEHGEFDVLDVSADTNRLLDRRVAVALATLVLGSEP